MLNFITKTVEFARNILKPQPSKEINPIPTPGPEVDPASLLPNEDPKQIVIPGGDPTGGNNI